MELAINTLVVMILGILIVGSGIVLVSKISGSGIEVVEQLSKDKEQQLQSMLAQGQLVAVFPSSQEVAGGKSTTFGIGVFNVQDTEQVFSFSITSETAPVGAGEDEWRISYIPLTVPSKGRATAPIIVTPGNAVPAGTYTFIVNVTYQDAGEAVPHETRFFTVRVR